MSPWRAAGARFARAAMRGGVATSARARGADRAPWMHAAEARTRGRASGWTTANTCFKRGASSNPPAPSDVGAASDVVAALPGLGLALAVSQAGFALADGISAAVGAPRVHHQWYPEQLIIEQDALSPDTREALRALGHELAERRAYGNAMALWRRDDGVLTGAADPRGEGTAGGVGDQPIDGLTRPSP